MLILTRFVQILNFASISKIGNQRVLTSGICSRAVKVEFESKG